MFQERDDHYELTPTGWTFESCTLGWGVVLTLMYAPSFQEIEIKIEQDFALKQDNSTSILSPTDFPTLSPLLPLIKAPVENLKIFKSGQLEIKFRDNYLILVPPHILYEAWEPRSHDDTLIVCLPGGTLAIFNGAEIDRE